MWRPVGEQICECTQVDPVSLFECQFAYLMLLNVVITTKADRPVVRRLERYAAIGIASDMGALDRASETPWDAAVMAAHPGTVSWALAAVPLAGVLALKPVREP